MRVEIVTIGDELLLGFTIDTNAAHLARELAASGIRIVRRTTAGDDPEAIAAAVRDALDRTGAVITTGGLGPTADDRTKPVIADLFGRAMRLDDEILSALAARWQKRFGKELPATNHQQAMVPEGAEILRNAHGSAPGIWLEDARGRWVAMLPGVPREMRGMLADTLGPRLRARAAALRGADGAPAVVRSKTIRTANIAESALADRLGPLARAVNGLTVAFLPGNEGVDLRITSAGKSADDADAELAAAARELRERTGHYVYGEDRDDLAELMVRELRQHGLTVAVAESCTGGLLGSRFTAVSGASAVFAGGIIAYDNAVKIRELGVSPRDLEEHGAVSETVARAMAVGVRSRFATNVGIGVTGVAGPDGGSDDKPVGTVWVAVDLDGDVHAVRGTLPGDRNEIRFRGTQLALDRLRRSLDGDVSASGWTARS